MFRIDSWCSRAECSDQHHTAAQSWCWELVQIILGIRRSSTDHLSSALEIYLFCWPLTVKSCVPTCISHAHGLWEENLVHCYWAAENYLTNDVHLIVSDLKARLVRHIVNCQHYDWDQIHDKGSSTISRRKRQFQMTAIWAVGTFLL